jgi:hypothetical protein
MKLLECITGSVINMDSEKLELMDRVIQDWWVNIPEGSKPTESDISLLIDRIHKVISQ